ncbi:MAG TPA: tRNA (N(6)-L-threonylcarbamoyladenosine(37)-C(2))-methylthiotransferase MtaB [Tenuifilum sp.]|uniref:tRNA (N(6)-L-threonylcarbamoyladenosine(37)-C(2))- methylthiotransferase MtaB n=2 Tax=Tenuifilum sp. TaxID=2760880 RepID=UPI002D0329D1|nr:tRNA (N(6)-L-threonylcarbamoyladenosine(37)-C(2))-methylthiotransferase MtaB [Tenuifilum sp.]HQG72721.1 tRNA (N(6)-L-threonylcarbamoyladenosine(37)-C(2))-methylthiotransferase MtaB [Tenuifilum sp.]HRS43815.1 tRNA (N(6)-L-threonylcarbamoyladenosine(37)-C(2))-methylthiotransferase MtaB [Tenuifilum sp.]
MNQVRKRVAFYTLGCKLNFSESSTIARQFADMGYERVSPDSEADVYVINTCSVTEHADKKCRQAIRKFTTKSPNAMVAVVGCYAQLKPEEIAQIDGVDFVLGAADKFNLPHLIGNDAKKTKVKVYSCDIDSVSDFFPAYSTGDRTRSFLKVQDGCDYHCSYCTIPLARGKSRNMPISQIVDQAKAIASQNVKEIILTGVNTGDFGKSSGETFLELIQQLDRVEGIERFRISSIEPNLITPEIVDFVAQSAKFLPHFHIPLQSGSNRILALMRRRYRRELFAERIELIRSRMPDTFFGVDVIVGFPGETDDDFSDAFRFIEQVKPSFLHIFPYSERPNTPATEFEGKVSPKVVKQRVTLLTVLSDRLHKEFFLKHIGQIRPVLVESSRKGDYMFGFTDNYIKVGIPFDKGHAGKVVKVRLEKFTPDGFVEGLVI